MKIKGSYTVIPDALMNSDRLSPADKAVFIALLHFADKDGACWPSIRILAEFIHAGDRTVQRSIKKLQSERLIIEKRKSHVKSCFYQLAEPHVGQRDTHDTKKQATMPAKATKSANVTPISMSANVTPLMSANVTPELISTLELKREREKERKALFSQPKEQPAQEKDQANQEPNRPKAIRQHAKIDDVWQQNELRPEPGPEPELVGGTVRSYIPHANHETLGQLHKRLIAAAGDCKGCRFNGGYEQGGHCTAQFIWDKDRWRALSEGMPQSCLKLLTAPPGTGGKV
jgi:hypothetical protein